MQEIDDACSGIPHGEANREPETTRIFQIWIVPVEHVGKPAWGAKPFPKADRSEQFVTLASGFANDNRTLPIRANARVLGATVRAGERVRLTRDPARCGDLVLATGAIDIGGVRIEARDGAAISDLTTVDAVGIEDAEVILADAA